jgi:aminobenzoyl-glutamate transport protein
MLFFKKQSRQGLLFFMRRQGMPELQTKAKEKGFLGWIERVGNKIPHPFLMFLELTAIVLVLSFILGLLKVSAVHPNGQTITVFNFLSWGGLSKFAYNFISTWQNFQVLGIVFLFAIATSLCERTGLFAAAVKLGLSRAKGNLVVVIFAFVGVLMTNLTGDVAFILVPSIGEIGRASCRERVFVSV